MEELMAILQIFESNDKVDRNRVLALLRNFEGKMLTRTEVALIGSIYRKVGLYYQGVNFMKLQLFDFRDILISQASTKELLEFAHLLNLCGHQDSATKLRQYIVNRPLGRETLNLHALGLPSLKRS